VTWMPYPANLLPTKRLNVTSRIRSAQSDRWNSQTTRALRPGRSL